MILTIQLQEPLVSKVGDVVPFRNTDDETGPMIWAEIVEVDGLKVVLDTLPENENRDINMLERLMTL